MALCKILGGIGAKSQVALVQNLRWHWCITGELTEEENLVSGILASMWTQVKKKKEKDDILTGWKVESWWWLWLLQFAVSGNPGHGAQQWTREDKWYSKITTSVQQVREEDSFVLMIRKGWKDIWCQAKDYHLSYHFASEGGDLTTTTAAPVFWSEWKTVFLSVEIWVFLSICGKCCSLHHLNKAGSCPENWQEMKITQDSGEVAIHTIISPAVTNHLFITNQFRT